MRATSHTPATPASGEQALATVAPEVAALVRRLSATLPPIAGAPTVAWARDAVVAVTGLTPLPGAAAPATGESGPLAEVSVEVAAQLALDVSQVDDTHRARITEVFGRAGHTWLLTVYLADWIPRVRHALDAAFGPSDWEVGPVSEDSETLWLDFSALTQAIGALQALDPVVAEVVRLRMARQHNCALCKSLRNRTALEAGGTESTYEQIDTWQDSTAFDGRTRAALAAADALVWTPAAEPGPFTGLREHFSTEETVEVLVDMLRNAANKVAIAGATDAANVESGWEVYDVTTTGETVFGLGVLA